MSRRQVQLQRAKLDGDEEPEVKRRAHRQASESRARESPPALLSKAEAQPKLAGWHRKELPDAFGFCA